MTESGSRNDAGMKKRSGIVTDSYNRRVLYLSTETSAFIPK